MLSRITNTCFFILLLALLSSCGQSIDKKFVSEVEVLQVEAEKSITSFKDTNTKFTNFSLLAANIPQSIKESAGGRLEELSQQVQEYAQKTAVNVEPLEAHIAESKQFLSDYSAGKIKTAEAKERYKQISANLTSIQQISTEFGSAYEAFNAEFRKIVEQATASSAPSSKR